MVKPHLVGLVFLALGAVFLLFALRDATKPAGNPLARRTWLRLAAIFTAVGVALHLVRLLVG